MNLKEALVDKLTEEEIGSLRTSFDLVGDIAIIEIPDELEYREKEIAEAIVKIHPRIRTVCRKMGERKGKYRLREIKIILGKGTETIHKEHGSRFKVDVKYVYFSPRESTERQRIADNVKKDETIMVFFAGVGPFAIVIAKKKKIKKVYGIELNKKAYECMNENVKLNKLKGKFIPVLGNVKNKAPKYFGKCDRVLMPLPTDSVQYLELGMKCLKKKGGIIHFYYITPDIIFSDITALAKKKASKLKKNVRVLSKRQVLPFGPHRWKNCVDFEVY